MTKIILASCRCSYFQETFRIAQRPTLLSQMLYELLRLIDFAEGKAKEGRQLALAMIIHTEGSSYRKTGTQMVVADDATYAGALSGGCVEKEVVRQSERVFAKKESVVFPYDGRYKLGCKGVIHILVEYFDPAVLSALAVKVREFSRLRKSFRLGIKRDHFLTKASSYFCFDDEHIHVSATTSEAHVEREELEIPPQYQLVVIGGEPDSVVLAGLADQIGMRTLLVVKESFVHPVAKNVKVAYLTPEGLVNAVRFDDQTAIVFMTHSLSKDLSYLVQVVKVKSAYMGVLGPPSRKELLLNEFMEYNETLFLAWQDKLERMHGPVGLGIGARTPEEISIAVLGEIISVFNHKSVPVPLA